jgi:hypothetical protein
VRAGSVRGARKLGAPFLPSASALRAASVATVCELVVMRRLTEKGVGMD